MGSLGTNYDKQTPPNSSCCTNIHCIVWYSLEHSAFGQKVTVRDLTANCYFQEDFCCIVLLQYKKK